MSAPHGHLMAALLPSVQTVPAKKKYTSCGLTGADRIKLLQATGKRLHLRGHRFCVNHTIHKINKQLTGRYEK
jgi:hypothetical protein